MKNGSHDFAELLRIFKDLPFDAVCRDCRGQCCQMPWLAQEEHELAGRFPEATEFVGGTAFFRDHDRCVFLGGDGKCKIYEMRPLDCRLFPLDIIEENGEYFWCVFTVCPNWRKMAELLKPLIPALEKRIGGSLWRQFMEQIATTKTEYLPYKNGRYVIIQKLAKNYETHS